MYTHTSLDPCGAQLENVCGIFGFTREACFFLGCQRKLGERKTREYSKEKKLAVRNGERIS